MTEIRVNVFGYNPKWKGGEHHKYFTGKFVYQQTYPEDQQLMDTEGNLNLDSLKIDDKVEIIYTWMSPWVAHRKRLYRAEFWEDPDDNFWVVKGNGKPKLSDKAPGTGQFEVERLSPTRLKVTDENKDTEHYTYALAVRLLYAEQEEPDKSKGEFFVDDPKITNRGNNRVVRS